MAPVASLAPASADTAERASMTIYAVTDPVTGTVLAEYPTASDTDIERAIERAHAGAAALAGLADAERADALRRVAELHLERIDELAAIVTREMGKPIAQAREEIELSAAIYRYYADNGPRFLADEEVDAVPGGVAVVRKEPVGAVLGIMPWNYPFYQVARFAAPNTMIGNAVLLKHAPQDPESALAIEAIHREAGLPEGAYVNVFASVEQVAAIIADPRVQGVSLTGSERAGAAVAELAGRSLKKVVLELGGSDPFLLFDTEDLDASVELAVLSRLENCGQACNAAKRFIVLGDLYDAFVDRLSAAFDAIEPGDPADPATVLGPLSSLAAADGLEAQVRAAVAAGATVRAGGGRVAPGSAYFLPTVLTGVTPEMAAYREELFGPVALVFRADSEEEAVAIANDTPFGLGASVHTADPERAERVAERLEAGMIFVNEPPGTAPELPFGGVKRSGIGRELGRYGMEEFVNRKLVRVATVSSRSPAARA